MNVTRVQAAAAVLLLLAAPAGAADQAKATSGVYDIPRMDKVVIDGKADDWGQAGFRVDLMMPPETGPKPIGDLDARFRLAWNDRGLLVLAFVRDDKWIEHKDEGWMWRYDGVEVFLAPRPGAKDMCQWAISPGMTAAQKTPRSHLHDHRKRDELKKLPAQVKVARGKTKTGYALELLVPWSSLAIEPKAGREVGFQIYVNDADKVDGNTSHAVWYPADNTGFDSNNMHRVRLADRPSPAVQAGGSWQYEWPRISRAALWTTASTVGKELAILAADGRVLARGAVKPVGGRGRVELEMPVAFSPPGAAFVQLRVADTTRGVLLVHEDVRDNSLSKYDINALRKALLGRTFRKRSTKPDLLFPAKQAAKIRALAAAQKDQLNALRKRCKAIIATSPDAVTEDYANNRARQAETVAIGYFFLRDPAFAIWAKRRVKALFGLKTWMFSLHKEGCRFTDHVMTNVGSTIARTHDLLGDRYSPKETREVAAGVRRLMLLPYLKSARGRKEWWSGKGVESNWKIMCHGEAGLTICEFGEYWPEAREALAHAALGVVEILDMVPPEGGWHEGVGYWLSTLHDGLRYVTALRLLTGGAVNVYKHPALKTTGDFSMMLTTPGRHVFNFSDNKDTHSGHRRECLAVLAKEAGRADWMYIARGAPALTPLYLACAGGDLPSKKPDKMAAIFPRAGVATVRSGWDKGDTFVGVKFGAATVGHGHLDAASFVIESGGQWLVKDPGYWRYAAQIGFHDYRRYRWNWDGMATVGHNTLLIDGKGQTWQQARIKTPHSLRSGKGWYRIVADVSKCYPGLVKKFVRTVLFVKPDVVIVRDVVECEGERHAEWLLHYAGKIRSEGLVSVIENKGVSMTVVPFRPDRKFGWRVNDVLRTSTYQVQRSRKDTTQAVRYRSFSPFRKAAKIEFLFGLRVSGRPDGKDWTFKTTDKGWTLRAAGHKLVIRPEGDTLSVE